MSQLITLQEVAAQNTGPEATGASEGPANSLQLLVNHFAYRYDANLRGYVQLRLLRLISSPVAQAVASR